MCAARTFDPTERRGVNAVEKIFTDAGWIFREQLVADFGVDAHAERPQDGRPTGQLLAIQIKSGASHFRMTKSGATFYIDDAHMAYWATHFLPMILILHNPKIGMTIWQWANYAFAKKARRNWRIDLPLSNILDNSALAVLSARLQAEAARRRDERSVGSRTEAAARPDRAIPARKTDAARAGGARTLSKAIASAMEYYRTEFEPRFQIATNTMKAIPASSSEEVRNAFAHLSVASAIAAQSGNDLQDKDAVRNAHQHIARARQHLAWASYDAVTTTATFRFREVTDMVASLGDRDRTVRLRRDLLSVERKFEKLSSRLRDLGPSDNVEDYVHEADSLLRQMHELLSKLRTLLKRKLF